MITDDLISITFLFIRLTADYGKRYAPVAKVYDFKGNKPYFKHTVPTYVTDD